MTENGKSYEEKIDVPVLFGQDNQIDKSFTITIKRDTSCWIY